LESAVLGVLPNVRGEVVPEVVRVDHATTPYRSGRRRFARRRGLSAP
jgi:hypothetical protein